MDQRSKNNQIVEISENDETHPEYVKYVQLLREYFIIKNDEVKTQAKFQEILRQHKRLVNIGIITV